jgi:hypothetical protein
MDIVARLRRKIDPSIYEYEFARRGEREEAAVEIEQLREKLGKIAAHPDTPVLIKQYARGDLDSSREQKR